MKEWKNAIAKPSKRWSFNELELHRKKIVVHYRSVLHRRKRKSLHEEFKVDGDQAEIHTSW